MRQLLWKLIWGIQVSLIWKLVNFAFKKKNFFQQVFMYKALVNILAFGGPVISVIITQICQCENSHRQYINWGIYTYI